MSGLDWPDGFERTPEHKQTSYPHGFRHSRTRAFRNILEEVGRLGGVNPRISTDVQHRSDNPAIPYKDPKPDDPGVVVYFDRDGKGHAVPCDKWDNLRDNAQAIAKYLNAKRALERYGVQTVESEFSTQALPAGDEDAVVADEPAHSVLGVAPDAPPDVVKAVARRLSANVHPDSDNPDVEEYKRVQRAKKEMLKK